MRKHCIVFFFFKFFWWCQEKCVPLSSRKTRNTRYILINEWMLRSIVVFFIYFLI